MFMCLTCIYFVILKSVTSDYLDELRRQIQPINKNYDYSRSYFGTLLNYYVGATYVSESQYPWIAKVLHSHHHPWPHVCTAACIEPGIFVTAARCIATLKVNYTSIVYKNKQYPVIAFVLPSKPTRQYFDDVGFAVISKSYRTFPDVIKVFESKRRSGYGFEWYDHNYAKFVDKVVGFALPKADFRRATAKTKWDLRSLPVISSLDLCARVHQEKLNSLEFRVPCYHSCDAKVLKDLSTTDCKFYHGAEGSAVISKEKTPRIIGVATWGNFEERRQIELPVGFAVLNSDTFHKDLQCAKKIRTIDVSRMVDGYLQELCS